MLQYAENPQGLVEITTSQQKRNALHLAAACTDFSAAATVRAVVDAVTQRKELYLMTDYIACSALQLAVNDCNEDVLVEKVRVLLELAPNRQAIIEQPDQNGRNSL